MLSEESEIGHLSQIVQEVAKRTGFSEERIKEVYYKLMDYLKWMIMNTSVVSIEFPYIGVLYWKIKGHHVTFNRNLGFGEKRKKQDLERLNKIMELQDLRKNEKKKSRIKHCLPTRIRNPKYKQGKNIEFIEQFQNQIGK